MEPIVIEDEEPEFDFFLGNHEAAKENEPEFEDFEVEKIVDQREIQGQVEVKVRWKGHGSEWVIFF